VLLRKLITRRGSWNFSPVARANVSNEYIHISTKFIAQNTVRLYAIFVIIACCLAGPST
jgi:hypothetical protein